ncbi:protein FdhD [mine drainage metagenome]|uniref:Protein FdhD n=1 Tax=mine drainage metagenome TaxID=410659 RepID=A0A1J5RGV0_9ZZZZ
MGSIDTLLAGVHETAGMRQVGAMRVPAAGQPAVEDRCWLLEEQALFIEVAEVGLYTLMWTRTDIAAAAGFLPDIGVLGDVPEPDALALSIGFLLTEGMIACLDDIAELAVCPEAHEVVRVRLVRPAQVRTNRQGGFVASSCGACGPVGGVADLRAGLIPVGDALRIEPRQLQQLMTAMEARQRLFNRTGGAHAAAVFSPGAEILATAEDLGRHNALDKAIGQCLLRGRATAGCGVLMSGRVSLEMIVKAARAGIELVAAVSAPSSLAVEAAAALDITLCGFVRDGRSTAFSQPRRLLWTGP